MVAMCGARSRLRVHGHRGWCSDSVVDPTRAVWWEGLALVGIVSGAPSLVALLVGVWLVAQVCITGALAALAAIVSVPGPARP